MKTNSPAGQNLCPRTPNFGAWLPLLSVIMTLIFTSGAALGATVTVTVGNNLTFEPGFVTIHPGDTVNWVWNMNDHSVTSGVQGVGGAGALFNSGIRNNGATFQHTFPDLGSFEYFCSVHSSCCGMIGFVNVTAGTPTPTPNPAAAQPLNISTRLRVQTGENVLIGGFIITGTAPKKVIVRGIGPSLSLVGLTDVLADPVVELKGPGVSLGNDNWMDAPNKQEIIDSTVAPKNDLESAILTTLAANNSGYTAIVSGKNATTGVGLVEVYDLNQAADSKLANISTRGLVQTGSNVMIGGFILGGGSANANILVRAIGPSLTQAGISGALADPTLELRDGNGMLIRINDNWKDSQQAEIQATTIPPTNDLESAIVAPLPPGVFTAIVAGKNGASGVGLVEVYRLQ